MEGKKITNRRLRKKRTRRWRELKRTSGHFDKALEEIGRLQDLWRRLWSQTHSGRCMKVIMVSMVVAMMIFMMMMVVEVVVVVVMVQSSSLGRALPPSLPPSAEAGRRAAGSPQVGRNRNQFSPDQY